MGTPVDWNDIVITMLGPSGSGKTSFMVGMYRGMQRGTRGFTFSCADTENEKGADADLRLSQMYERMRQPGANRWPPKNNEIPIPYAFRLNYGLKKLLGFRWLDYRGGALYSESSAPDVQALVAQLKASSCVLVCVSGEYLDSPDRRDEAWDECRIDRITALLTQVNDHVTGNGGRLPAVGIVITKFDRCAHRSPEELQEQIQDMFHPLFAVGSNWLVTVCPVTLGSGLADDCDGAELGPKHVHLPITFAIYQFLYQKRRDLQGQARALTAQIQRSDETKKSAAKRKLQLGGNSMKDWWNRNGIDKEVQRIKAADDCVRGSQERLRLSEQELQRAQHGMSLLFEKLNVKVLRTFWNGEEVELGLD